MANVGIAQTITGVFEVLKKKKPALKSYTVEPEDSGVLPGGKPGLYKIQNIKTGFVPSLFKSED